jgi:SAM-dependent methyltransferase
VRRYEQWFEDHPSVYHSELEAVRVVLPESTEGLEIGVGSGRFAAPLGIRFGVDPSSEMAQRAAAMNIRVVRGVAEQLPFVSRTFGFALMVTTLGFLDDVARAFGEAHRVLKPNGAFVVGFVDKASFLGQRYQEVKAESIFYGVAEFYSVSEVSDGLLQVGFGDPVWRQTVFTEPGSQTVAEPVRDGFGEGAFVVVRVSKGKRGWAPAG